MSSSLLPRLGAAENKTPTGCPTGSYRLGLRGYGIAYVPEDIVARQIASRALVQVLDDWSPFFDGYFLCYSSRRQNLPALQVIVNALR